MSEQLFDAYKETENVRCRNTQLEIELKDFESSLREKDVEVKYLSESMDKEMEIVIRERDIMMQKCRLSCMLFRGSLQMIDKNETLARLSWVA